MFIYIEREKKSVIIIFVKFSQFQIVFGNGEAIADD